MRSEEREEMERLYSSGPDVIGDWGEIITAIRLRQELDMRVVRSLYIGKSQIDMIGVSPYGLLVIENKNYHGLVVGSTKDKYWKAIYTPVEDYDLYSPVLQNEKHKEAVRKMLSLLGYADIPVYSVVIFNDSTVLHVQDEHKTVFSLSDFIDRYKSYAGDTVVSAEMCSRIADLLYKYQDGSAETLELHVAGILRKRAGGDVCSPK